MMVSFHSMTRFTLNSPDTTDGAPVNVAGCTRHQSHLLLLHELRCGVNENEDTSMQGHGL